MLEQEHEIEAIVSQEGQRSWFGLEVGVCRVIEDIKIVGSHRVSMRCTVEHEQGKSKLNYQVIFGVQLTPEVALL